MNERRFSEDEVAEILARATRPDSGSGGPHPVPADPRSASPGGFTLAELQEIGGEAGVSPRRIAEAARDVASSGSPTEGRTLFGTPRTLSREMAVRGPMDDETWERAVALLREVFGGKGESTRDGRLRSWSWKDVEAHLEPDPAGDGWRLRLTARESASRIGVQVGGGLALFGAFFVGVAFLTGVDPSAAWVGGLLALFGVGIGASGALVLPRWARRRGAQIEEVARGAEGLAFRDPEPSAGG
jgi:hypothetical protein